MSGVASELEQALSQLDARSAVALERLVRDAVMLARSAKPVSESGFDAKGWPAGYFETTAGLFANEPLDFPSDPPSAPKPAWNVAHRETAPECARPRAQQCGAQCDAGQSQPWVRADVAAAEDGRTPSSPLADRTFPLL